MCESRFTVLRLVFAVAVAVCISNCQAVAQEAPASPDPPVEPAISPEDAQRIQAKANAVLAEVQAQAAAGNVRQEVIAKMEKLGPLTDSGKLVEAEALLDEVLKDLGITVKLPQSEPEPQQKPSGDAKDGTPMSEVPPQKELSSTQLRLMKKGQLAVAEFKRRAESGDVLRNVADRLEQFGGLMEASKFKQAEALIDEALQALGIDPQTLKKKARKRSAFDKQKPALGHSGPVSSGPLPKFDSTEFTKIFDGESLDGWNGDPTYWSVENGKLAGTVTPDTLLEKNSWILWQGGSVEDFELVLDYRVSVQGNSGIGYRLAVLEGEPYSVRGPQADIDGRGMFSGICYEENGRRLLAGRGQTTWIGDSATLPRLIAQLGDPAQLRAILRTEDWNRYRLVVKGNVAKHFINGALMSEVHDHDESNRMSRGLIGMQVYVGPPMKVEFRDIYLKHFSEPADVDAAHGSFGYQPGSLVELEHGLTFENLEKQAHELTAPLTSKQIDDRDALEIVTRDLAVVRHGLQEVQLFGGTNSTLGNQASDTQRFDLVVSTPDFVVRVPRSGFRLIGRPLDRDYRVRLQWNAEHQHYELVDLAPADQESDAPVSGLHLFQLGSPANLRQVTGAELPDWAEDAHTFIMSPVRPDRALQLHVSVNGAWGGIPGRYSILPNDPDIQREYNWDQAAFAAAVSGAGLVVPAAINTIEGFHLLRESVPNFDEMACRTADGNLIVSDEMILMCPINPDWVQWEVDCGKTAIDAGAQWVLLDTPMGASFVSGMLQGGFCDHCLANFESYLKQRYSPLAMAFRFGTKDFDRAKIAQRLTALQKVTPMEQSAHLQTSADARLFKEFVKCQEETNFASRRHVMETLYQYSKDQGKEVLFCTNAANLGAHNPGGHWVRGLKFADLADLFSYELNNEPHGQLGAGQTRMPRGKWAAFHKLAYAVHHRRSPALIHVRDINVLRKQAEDGHSSRTWMAAQAVEAYAAGGAYIPFHVEIGSYDELAIDQIWRGVFEHNRFVQEHQSLFTGDQSSGSNVAILFLLNERGRTIPAVFPSYLGLAQGFVESHYPFDVVFAGDDRYVADRLTPQQLESYGAIVVPSPVDPTENQKQIIQQFAYSGGVVICQEPEILGLDAQTTRRSQASDSWWSHDFYFGRGTVRVLSGDVTATETHDVGTRFYRQYTPELRRQVAEIAEYLGLRPVLEGQYDARLSAFPVIQSDRGRVIVHVVNCDVDYEQDTIGAQQDVRVSIRTPDFLHDVNSGVLYNCKTGMDVPIAVYHRLGRLEMTIPELGRGAVVVIAGDD